MQRYDHPAARPPWLPSALLNAGPTPTPPSHNLSGSENTGPDAAWTLPADLGAVAGKPALLKLCLDGVQHVPVSELARARTRIASRQATGASGARPEMLLTLLTYCYATGLYSSEDIVDAAYKDATVRYICGSFRPDETLLRWFRRHHREPLRAALVHVFKQVWAFHFETGEAIYAGCDWFESELTTQFEHSATLRLDAAALMDDPD